MDSLHEIKQLLSAFDRPRKQALDKYLASPYFQIAPDIIQLLNQWNGSDMNHMDDREIKKRLGNPTTSLLRHTVDVLLQFIQQYEFDQLSTLKANANLAGVRKNNIENLYKDTLSNIEKLSVTEFDQSSEYFFYRSLIEKNIFELKTENEKKNAKVKIASELNMHKISENVDIFYILEILKNALTSFLDSPESWHEINSMTEIQFSLEAGQMYENKVPVIYIYRRLWEMLGLKKLPASSFLEWQNAYDQIRHKIPEMEIEFIDQAKAMLGQKQN